MVRNIHLSVRSDENSYENDNWSGGGCLNGLVCHIGFISVRGLRINSAW